MAKQIKFTRGMLCRDATVSGTAWNILLITPYTRADFPGTVDSDGWWYPLPGGSGRIVAAWKVAAWKATYSLRPPAPGKCFECDVEL